MPAFLAHLHTGAADPTKIMQECAAARERGYDQSPPDGPPTEFAMLTAPAELAGAADTVLCY